MPCDRHPDRDSCKLESPDIFCACAPCQPYSVQRRTGPSSAEAHADYKTLWGEEGSVLSMVQRLLPKIFVSENVMGFEGRKQELINQVFAIKNRAGEQHFTTGGCIKLDAKDWVTCSRPRPRCNANNTPRVLECKRHLLPTTDFLRRCKQAWGRPNSASLISSPFGMTGRYNTMFYARLNCFLLRRRRGAPRKRGSHKMQENNPQGRFMQPRH